MPRSVGAFGFEDGGFGHVGHVAVEISKWGHWSSRASSPVVIHEHAVKLVVLVMQYKAHYCDHQQDSTVCKTNPKAVV